MRWLRLRSSGPSDGTVADTWDTTTWTWDTDWVGGLSLLEGPWGTDEIGYGDNDGLGAFGWPTRRQRTFDALPATVQKSFHYDLAGRVTREVTGALTSGMSALDVRTRYVHGVPVEHTVREGTTQIADVDLQYDALGRPSGWESPTGFRQTMHWEMAARPQKIHGYVPAFPGGEALQVTLTPARNQWPASKRVLVWDPEDALPAFDLHDPLGNALIEVDYTYDDLGRVSGVLGPTQAYEQYTYDDLGNLTFMSRDTPQFGTAAWDYTWPGQATSHVPHFQELSGRTLVANGSSHESYDYDPVTGRMTSWSTVGPSVGLDPTNLEHEPGATRTLRYDGAGRLGELARGTDVTAYVYAPDDSLVLTTDGTTATKTYFEGATYDFSDNTLIVDLLPMLRWHNGELLWVYAEPDGHPLAVVKDSDSTLVSFEVSGAYGRPIASVGSWDHERLQGQELDRASGLTQMGVRSVMASDGRWLQPEPLLGLGIPAGRVVDPLAWSPSSAACNPIVTSDLTGFANDVNSPGQMTASDTRAANAAFVAGAGVAATAHWVASGAALRQLTAFVMEESSSPGFVAAVGEAGAAFGALVFGEDAPAPVVTLYRAVGAEELASIRATSELGVGEGMEGKWFAESAEDAASWGAKMDFGGKSTVIEADFPATTDLFRIEKLDGIGPARYAEASQLQDCAAIRIPNE